MAERIRYERGEKEMIEQLPVAGGEVLGFRLSGIFTEEDFIGVLVPALDEASQEHGIIRLIIEVMDFKDETLGAMIQDYRHKGQFPHIEREAIVGDENWDRWTGPFRDFFFLFPNTEVRFFGHDQRQQAWDWIFEGLPRREV
jgi:hypothetical protein